jgi:L-ascorbate metabolism protein UlaG (beta-lactamase superfamily)
MKEFDFINWFGHASFSFTDQNGNLIYYIDPFDFKTKNLQDADLIFITHAHYDHFSQNDIKLILNGNTTLVGTGDVLEKLDIQNKRKFEVKPNNSYTIKDFSFATIPAYNNHPQRLNFHPKSNNWVGYVFGLNDKMIYHAGDTDFTQEMKRLKNLNLDIAMLPIGGTYTMDVNEAATAANIISAKITIPMHYKNLLREKSKEAEEKFKKLVTNSRVEILKELS